jgi:hypothetical protein
MAQASVSAPQVQFAGKVETGGPFPNTIISRIGSEAIGFGIAACALAVDDLTHGGQSCELPNVTADVNAPLLLGIAIADTSKEEVAGVGTWSHEDSVSILKNGQIWVESAQAITSLAEPVCIENDSGAFDMAVAGNFIACTSMKWIAYELVGSTHYGLVQVDL